MHQIESPGFRNRTAQFYWIVGTGLASSGAVSNRLAEHRRCSDGGMAVTVPPTTPLRRTGRLRQAAPTPPFPPDDEGLQRWQTTAVQLCAKIRGRRSILGSVQGSSQ